MAGMYENGWNRLNLLQWVDAAERAERSLEKAGYGWNV